MLSKDIWVFVEYRDHEVETVTLEMLGEARKLTEQLNGKACACLMGCGVEEYIPTLRNYGAEKLYLSDNDFFSEYSLDAYVFAFQTLIEKYNPLVIFFGATPHGSELAARVAARMKFPIITEVKRIAVEGENIAIANSCYDDKVHQNFDVKPDKNIVLTFLPGEMESDATNATNEMEIVKEEVRIPLGIGRTKCIKFKKGDPKKIRIEEADLIVAGGKGIGNGLPILEDIADVLGASIGGTRPLVDDGTIPFERQIGITGKTVYPRMLMALGTSGAREFTAGIENAGLTIAINTDDKAPIFKTSDLGIHGDIHEIIPPLVKKLKQRKEQDNK